MRTVWFFIYMAASLIPKFFQALKMKRLKAKTDDTEFFVLANKIVNEWARRQLKNSGARVKIYGEDNIPKDEPVLFVSNHQGNFDIAVFLGLLPKPKGYIAKVETMKLPVVRTWMKYIGCVFMDRNDMRSQAKAIIDGINNLKKGYSMVIFPEGTRSKSSEMGEFKAGSFKLATKSLVKIVPVTIDGSYKIFEANGNRIKPADVIMTIHKPIVTKDMSKDELAKLPETVKSVIQRGLKNKGGV